MTVKIEAVAGLGKSDVTIPFILDKLPPVVTMISPKDGNVVNGVVDLHVTVIDSSLDTVTKKIGLDGTVLQVPDLEKSEWHENVVTTIYQTNTRSIEVFPATADPPFPGVWDLPVTIVATDLAGNSTTVSDYTMRIDNAGDSLHVQNKLPECGPEYHK